jgi:hypothetical protein
METIKLRIAPSVESAKLPGYLSGYLMNRAIPECLIEVTPPGPANRDFLALMLS